MMTTPFDALTQSEKIKFWQDIETNIDHALTLCEAQISDVAVKDIREYLSHNELGLAWEIFCEELIGSGQAPSNQTGPLILEVGSRMGYDRPQAHRHELWQRINSLCGKD